MVGHAAPSFDLPTDARIAVTGGAGGIGRALVGALQNLGARCFVLDLPQTLARHAVAGGAQALPCDATDAASLAAAFAAIDAGVGGLDGLVTLAGFAGPKHAVGDTPDALWDSVIDGNLTATFLTCKAALPLLRKAPSASIVTMASGLALKPTPGYGPYSVAKAGVLALTRLLAQENAPAIRANAVAPSAVDTAFLRGGSAQGGAVADPPLRLDLDAYVKSVPAGRIAVADDVVGPILFLLSRASGYMTGQTLHVNGGLLMV